VTGTRPRQIDRMSWAEALDRYGTDKPDLRIETTLVDLGEVFERTEVRAFVAPTVKGLRVPGGSQTSRSALDALVERAKALGARGLAWFRVNEAGAGEGAGVGEGGEGGEGGHGGGSAPGLDSPLARVLSDAERDGLVRATGAQPGDLVLAVADEHRTACTVLGQLRVELAGKPVGEGPYRYAWVVEFPLFESIDADGHPVPAHHPFTMPHPDDIDRMETDPLSVRSQAYDLVLNGWELGSGSVRIHRADIQARVFKALGISDEDAETRFGFLTGAFRYGAPPHAGFAFGIDRLAAVLAGEESIREVIAFPKTQSGSDPLTGAPKALSATSLAELGIRVAGK
jgi:aspartyl-tRNA synthetase